ncbi:hypothetical protein MOQ67_24835 [Pseudomonas sp. LY-1]|uniref:hypothetical protein n=1 Tax=Pseudomonas paraveronii TaxID=3040598 RepID=UPI002AAF5E1B|nr:hypothetical protein [Pseudomonas sp. V3/K/3/5]
MDNDRSRALKSQPADGLVTANINDPIGNFTSEDIQFHEFPEAIFIDAKSNQGQRLMSFQLANDIQPGTYDVAQEKSKVQVYYYHALGPTPWTYQPSSGELHLTVIDPEHRHVTATFSFTSLRVPEGEEPLEVTQGELNLTGA